jgi:hypothetical protein
MRQKLCNRIEELEKISAAAAARRASTSSGYKEKIARLLERSEAWHADPVNQKWLAEQPPDYLHHRVQSLRAQLAEIAYGHSRSALRGGL